jgi:hypothetical protein
LRIAHKAVPVPSNRIALPRENGRKINVSFKWTIEISGITLSHIVAVSLLVLVIASAAEFLLALILAGLHLFRRLLPQSFFSNLQ